ncbi:MAG: Rrf2 family transcriptional regulator [Candidatus Omnitrophota bacterium]
MKITYKGDYGLKTILSLSLNYGQGYLTIHQIAQRLDIPVKFLEQILLDLKRGGFVQSRRGRVGGYILARPPAKIRLGEVIRFIEGPLSPIACVDAHYKGCRDVGDCVFKDIWKQVAKATEKIIDSLSFEALAKKTKAPRTGLVYQI